MPARAPLRLVACCVVGVAAAAVAAVRARDLGPRLDIRVARVFRRPEQSMYEVRATCRGGETLAALRASVLRGAARVSPPDHTENLAPGATWTIRVPVSGETPVPAAVRIVQSGRVERVYDVVLEEQLP